MKYINIYALKKEMGIPYTSDAYRHMYTYRTAFRNMNAEEYGADILEDWNQYQKRREKDPTTHRRRLNVHGIISYSTTALYIGYYTNEHGATELIAAAMYGYSRTTSKQISAFLKSEGWSEFDINQLRAAQK